MALSGALLADFSSFTTACANAEVSLKSFEGNAGKVETALDRATNALSGVKIVQQAQIAAEAVDRIGGVSKLTEAELARVSATATEAAAKLTAMGQDVPPKIQALADATKGVNTSWQDFVSHFNIESAISNPLGTAKAGMEALAGSMGPAAVAALAVAAGVVAVGGALYELAENAAAVGGHLNDMSEKTGLSVPALSKLSLAAQVAGSDLDQLTNAVFMLQRNIGEDSPKVEAGLQKIGLSLGELKAVGVDNYLSLIAEHFKETVDPAARAAAAIELFNKPGRDMIPILMKIDEALLATNDITPWTESQAKDAEHFEMQLTSLKVHAEALATALGRDLIGPISTFVGAIVNAAQWTQQYIDLSGGLITKLNQAREGWGWLTSAIEVFRGAANDLPTVTGEATKGVAAWKDALKDLAIAVPTLKDATAAEQEMTAAGKDAAEASKVAAAAAKDQAATLAAVRKLEREDITAGLLGLSKLEQETSQKTFETQSKGYESIEKADSAMRDVIAKQALSSTDYQIYQIQRKADADIAAFTGTAQQRASYTAAVRALADQEAQGVQDAAAKIISAEAAKATAAEQAAARQAAASAVIVKGYYQQVDAAFAAMAAASGGLDSSSGSRVGTPNDGSMERGPAINAGGGAPINGVNTSAVPIFKLPQYEGGGATGAGGLSMLDPDEYVVPKGGALVRGAGSGASIINHIYVNGTAADVARQVAAEILRTIKQGQQLS
jgi:hypothetical protein